MNENDSLSKEAKKTIKENCIDFFVRKPLLFSMSWRFVNLISGRGPFNPELSGFKANKKFFENKVGLEIGGPSSIFARKSNLPVYVYAKTVDGCNFSGHTIWEGTISQGVTYKYDDQKIGNQFIYEGTWLEGISGNSYDFVIASHCIEHFVNPLKAVKEWLRVLKPGGALLVVAPDKRFTFDRRRQITLFDHLLDDYNSNVGEDDLSHLDEILSLHDLLMDRDAGDHFQFSARSLKNYENRCLHQHVFDKDLLKQIFGHFGVEVLYSDFSFPFNIIMMGKKGML